MPVLEFKDISKVLKSGFMRRPIYKLGPLSLEVEQGEIFGFLGPNGAGKTTSIKVAVGLLKADSGEIRVFGQAAGRPQAKRRVGFLPEHPYFYRHLTAFELLDFYGELFGLGRRGRLDRVERLLHLTGLSEFADMRLSRFSKGMLQRVGFAQALINDPDLVILDEPLSGLDPTGRRQIRDLIIDLRAAGKTVFFSSHILQDVEMICDRVGILLSGRLQRAAAMSEIMSQTVLSVEMVVDNLPPEYIRRLGLDDVEEKGGRTIVRLGSEDDVGQAIRIITGTGGRLSSVTPRRQSLEDYFMKYVESGHAVGEEEGDRGGTGLEDTESAPSREKVKATAGT
jgi:ABC-2 type transport system ATP-binding protein